VEFDRLAQAKVNLFLHVGALGDDAYHPLRSLVTFADVGDIVRIRRSEETDFRIEGPFAAGLSDGADNLVVRARDQFLMALADETPAFTLTLDKRLPIASGLGGGSADAAATLLLMAEAFMPPWLDDPDSPLRDIARRLGSDVPMCLSGVAALASGRGDELGYPPATFDDLDVVLVNPGVASPTGAVYRAYDDAGAPGGDDEPAWPESLETPSDLARFLAWTRNDLEAPAVALNPAILDRV
jgi:4-diphosphocytidyl-2-C-methyl-D-erythritol kinase